MNKKNNTTDIEETYNNLELKGTELIDYLVTHNKNNQIEFNINGFLDKKTVFEQIFNEFPVLYDNKKFIYIWNKELNKYENVTKDELYNYIINNISFYRTKEVGNKQIKININPFKKNNNSEIMNAILNYAMDFYNEKIIKLNKNEIAFKNKIINIRTLETKENNKNYFTNIYFDYELDLDNNNTPNIDRIFKQWVTKDKIPLLYELIGYSMLRDYPIHKLFCLYGAGRSGKGKFFEILSKVIGYRNICSTDFTSLNRYTHEIAKLYNKLVTSIAETNMINDLQTAKLKAIVGQNELSANQKNKDPFQFISFAKVIIETQFVPDSADISDGYVSRWILIPFNNYFDGTIDPLEQIPEQEYTALANKCVMYLHNLLKKGHFYNDLKPVEQKRQELIEAANPINYFIRKYTEESDGDYIKVSELTRKIQLYLKKKKYSITNALLHRKIRRLGLYVDRINIKNEESNWKTSRVYTDIRFKNNIKELQENIVINDHKNNDVFKNIIINDKIDYSKEYSLEELKLLINNENENDLMNIIKQLRKQGVIYQPKTNVYRFDENNKIN